jgi:two-component system sensor histidine kinase BaeS
MRRRLTVSVLLLIVLTLAVTTVGSYFFIRRAGISTTQSELAGQARAISTTFSKSTLTRATFLKEKKIITEAGNFAGATFIGLNPDGTYHGRLPAGITIADLRVRLLQSGLQVTGHTRSQLAYSAVPTPIDGVSAYTPVLVITRQIHNPANGLKYFVWVGVIALGAAALVAAALARRFTRPLTAAVATTRRIASGDLDATVPVGHREDPEFAQLAESINIMGANLVRARDQERQFLLSVSHELRTPLTSIRGYADAVLDGTADDPAAAASVISSESRRLERLVQDLLDLARLDANRFSLDVQTVDAAALATQVAEGFRPRAEELGITLTVSSEAGRPLWVAADPDRLAQVVANLVENASSFARGAVTVGAGDVGGVPTIWVADDGPGIPADQLPRVFERHFTSDRAGGRRKGSGLGLAIVSELSGAMGAGVRAESPVSGDGGTRMLVWFRPTAPPPPGPVDSGGGGVHEAVEMAARPGVPGAVVGDGVAGGGGAEGVAGAVATPRPVPPSPQSLPVPVGAVPSGSGPVPDADGIGGVGDVGGVGGGGPGRPRRPAGHKEESEDV